MATDDAVMDLGGSFQEVGEGQVGAIAATMRLVSLCLHLKMEGGGEGRSRGGDEVRLLGSRPYVNPVVS